jgi:hypothetical protein
MAGIPLTAEKTQKFNPGATAKVCTRLSLSSRVVVVVSFSAHFFRLFTDADLYLHYTMTLKVRPFTYCFTFLAKEY